MKKKLVVVFNVILAIVLGFNSRCMAATSTDIRKKIYGWNNSEAQGFFDAASYIGANISYITDVVCVITLMYLGIKWIVAAPEGKAEIKKHLVYVTVGLIISVMMTAVFTFIKQRTATNINIIDY